MLRKILKGLGILSIAAVIGISVVYFISRHEILNELETAGLIAETSVGPVQYALIGDSGPVILFAHGTPGGFNHTPFFSSFGLEGYRLLTPSRPGYMGTPLDAGRTPEEQAKAYAALLDELNIEKVVVIGVSGGGPSAISFAAMYPQRTLALIGLEALSQPYSEPLDIPLAMKSDFLFWVGASIATKLGGGKAMLGLFDPEDAERIERSRDGLERVHNWLWATWPVASRLTGWRNDSEQFMKFSLPVRQVEAPTLILNGTTDEAAIYEDAEKLATEIPGARLYSVEGANHAMLITHKDELNDVINEFLRDALSGNPPGDPSGLAEKTSSDSDVRNE
jgi:pimeloyl-ACP methyl ester carboxylesterase